MLGGCLFLSVPDCGFSSDIQPSHQGTDEGRRLQVGGRHVCLHCISCNFSCIKMSIILIFVFASILKMLEFKF